MSTIFGTRVLNEEFFREQEALPMVVCFYNSLNLLNVLGARTDFVRDDQTRSLFLELLRLFLSRYPERSLDLQHQSLHASDLSLNTTNIVFAPVETMAEYQSARTSSDAYERPSLQMSQRPTAKSTVGRKRIRK
jgi:hypothetical protein